jgi:hypothetical protein
MVKRTRLLVSSVVLTFGVVMPLSAGDYPSVTLESLLTPQQQATLNIADMTPQRREALREALIAAFTAGFQRGKLEGQKSTAAAAAALATPPLGSVIETQIDGDFEGWEGETIVKLMNGEIWQQTEYHYEYHYAFMPKVMVYQSGGSWKMKVDGTEQAVGVQRLR